MDLRGAVALVTGGNGGLGCVLLSTRPMKICSPGESRDPLINDSIGGTMGPGFRRECGLNLVVLSPKTF